MRADDREAIRQYFLGDEDGHIYFFYHPISTEAVWYCTLLHPNTIG